MKRLHQVFAVPALIAAATVFGLVSALVADGLWDLLSWFLLGVAGAVAAWFATPRERSVAYVHLDPEPSP